MVGEASEASLVTLLVKLGVVASLASILTRSSGMKRALLRELRTLNQRLGFDSDLRNYELPGAILRFFGLTAVRLLSNNPGKVQAVESAGVRVTERVPCVAGMVETRQAYLRTKKEKMGHLLE